MSQCVHAAGTLGECVPMGWKEAKDIRIWDRREERYRSEAERIGGGNPLFFFILPHREMRELILRGLHLFFSPLARHLFLYFTTFAFWHALCFLILIFQSYIQKVFLGCHSPLAFGSLLSVLLFECALSLILPHPSLQGLWVLCCMVISLQTFICSFFVFFLFLRSCFSPASPGGCQTL